MWIEGFIVGIKCENKQIENDIIHELHVASSLNHPCDVYFNVWENVEYNRRIKCYLRQKKNILSLELTLSCEGMLFTSITSYTILNTTFHVGKLNNNFKIEIQVYMIDNCGLSLFPAT